jgi:hypothetical protein
MKRRDASVELEYYDAKGPDIDFVVVWLLGNDLRRDIQWCTLEGVQTERSCRHFTRKTEVTEFNDTVTQEDVLWFQVPMHNTVVIEIQ